MNAALISDLHIDDNNTGDNGTSSSGSSLLDTLCDVLMEKRPDVVLVPGDISSDYSLSLNVVQYIETVLSVPVYFVPGNHDLWNTKHKDMASVDILAKLEADPRCISGRRVEFGAWQFVGEVGWYDETFAEGRFTLEEIETMSYKGRTWGDSRWVSWPRSMREQCDFFLARLEENLKGRSDRCMVLLHMVPKLEFTVRPALSIWTYFNALLGSARFGELLEKYDIPRAAFGHVHHRHQQAKNGVYYHCACLGNRNEWLGKDARAEIARTVQMIDLS